ncbi:hypothetical protein ACF0H5_008640 [Mactra antiquata]
MKYTLAWLSLCCVHTLSQAVITTKYKIISSQNASRAFLKCGHYSSAFDYCGARVTSNTCQLKPRDWCGAKNFHPNSSYIVKQSVTDVLEITRVRKYERSLPIVFGNRSGIELKFIPCLGLSQYTVELSDDTHNIVLQITLMSPDSWYFSSRVNNVWTPHTNYLFRLKTDVEVTLNIVSDFNKFIISLNGTIKEYSYTIPATKVNRIKSYFIGSMCHLLQVKYTAGF